MSIRNDEKKIKRQKAVQTQTSPTLIAFSPCCIWSRFIKAHLVNRSEQRLHQRVSALQSVTQTQTLASLSHRHRHRYWQVCHTDTDRIHWQVRHTDTDSRHWQVQSSSCHTQEAAVKREAIHNMYLLLLLIALPVPSSGPTLHHFFTPHLRFESTRVLILTFLKQYKC